MSELYSSIDLGTNTLRLLIAEFKYPYLQPIEMLISMPRIGADLINTNYIDTNSLKRTIHYLRVYSKILNNYSIKNPICFATASLRYAKNKNTVLQKIKKATDLEFTAISGEKEGYLSFLGATYSLGSKFKEKLVMVIDIGGGSTELSVGYPCRKPIISHSLRLGSCMLCEKFNLFEYPDKKSILNAKEYIIEQIKTLKKFQFTHLIGVAGTITTLKTISLKLEIYKKSLIQNSTLSLNEVSEIYNLVKILSIKQRLSMKGLPEGRADVIIGGSLITKTILEYFDVNSLIVSDEDIMYGVIYEKVGTKKAGCSP
ncbi:MAG: hypothetical protein AB1765_02935 [Candidatus Hydrogenedentota bacterium]